MPAFRASSFTHQISISEWERNGVAAIVLFNGLVLHGFAGKISTGNHIDFPIKYGVFPVNFPLNQSIELLEPR